MRAVLLGCLMVCSLLVASCRPPGQLPLGGANRPRPHALVQIGRTGLGSVLVDGNGMTLYMWAADRDGSSSCYGQCAVVWPPLLTKGTPDAGRGVDARKLAVTERTDGTAQVTYNGWPLYRYLYDRQARNLRGQGNPGFGAPWYVLAPGGTPIRKPIPGGLSPSPFSSSLLSRG